MELVRFRHKGLRQLYEDENPRAVLPAMVEKLGKLLFAMETADSLEQLGRFPGWKLHPLKGELKGYWAVTVRANWRTVFRFADGDAGAVDLMDYH